MVILELALEDSDDDAVLLIVLDSETVADELMVDETVLVSVVAVFVADVDMVLERDVVGELVKVELSD